MMIVLFALMLLGDCFSQAAVKSVFLTVSNFKQLSCYNTIKSHIKETEFLSLA